MEESTDIRKHAYGRSDGQGAQSKVRSALSCLSTPSKQSIPTYTFKMIMILLNSFASGMCPEMTLWGWLRAAERFCFWPRNDFVYFSESKKHFLSRAKEISPTENLE